MYGLFTFNPGSICLVNPNLSHNCKYFFGDFALTIDLTNSSLILSLLTPFKLGFFFSAANVSACIVPPSVA